VSARAAERRAAVEEFKRRAILEAARRTFRARGLEGASLREIARAAGYAPGALYLYFDGKEAIYAALLEESLAALAAHVEAARAGPPAELLLSFYRYYRERPDELDLGLYLYQGAARRGLGRARDRRLNAQLAGVVDRLAEALGGAGARRAAAALVAFYVGCLILRATGRLEMLGYEADELAAERTRELCGRAPIRPRPGSAGGNP
jgi:AcrR family transcriptional regulator